MGSAKTFADHVWASLAIYVVGSVSYIIALKMWELPPTLPLALIFCNIYNRIMCDASARESNTTAAS